MTGALKPAKLVLLGLLFNGNQLLQCQSIQSPRAHIMEAYRHKRIETPPGAERRWSKDFLISFSPNDRSTSEAIDLYDGGGALVREATISLPEAQTIGVNDAAVDGSGALFVAGGTVDGKGTIAHFLALMSPSGEVLRMVRTTPFIPRLICSAKNDGTIWAYGYDRDPSGNMVPNSPVLEQYSLQTGLLKRAFFRLDLDKEWRLTMGRYPGAVRMACNDEKVVVFNSGASEVLEYDLVSDSPIRKAIVLLPNAKELRITGFCMTNDGLVFASMHDRATKPPMTGVFQLTFDGNSKGQWIALDETISRYSDSSIGEIVGTNGTDLVYSKQLFGPALEWAKITR